MKRAILRKVSNFRVGPNEIEILNVRVGEDQVIIETNFGTWYMSRKAWEELHEKVGVR